MSKSAVPAEKELDGVLRDNFPTKLKSSLQIQSVTGNCGTKTRMPKTANRPNKKWQRDNGTKRCGRVEAGKGKVGVEQIEEQVDQCWGCAR